MSAPPQPKAPNAVARDVIARAEAMRDHGALLSIDEDETNVVVTQWNFVCRQGTERSVHSRYHTATERADRLTACRERGHLYITSTIGVICARCCRRRNGL